MSDSSQDETKFILNGNINKLVMKLSLPGVVGLLLLGLNNFVDAVFVGNLINTDGLVGITYAYPLSQMVTGFASLLGMGGATILSISLGKKDEEKISKILGNVLVSGVLIGVLVAITYYVFADTFVNLVSGDDVVSIKYGVTYLKSSSWGIPFTVLGLGLNVLIRSEGKMIVPMILFSMGFIVNIILTPISIENLNFGISGAAYATNISMVVAFLLNLFYFFTKKRIERFKPFYFNFDFKLIIQILKSGLPGLFLYVLTFIQQYLVLKLILTIGGTADVALFGALSRIMLLLVVPVYGISRALQPIVGINFGAGNLKRCVKSYKVFNLWGLLINLVLLIISLVYLKPLVKLILPEFNLDTESINNGYIFLSSIIMQPLLIFTMIFFQSTSKSLFAVVLILIRQLVLFLPLAYLLSFYLNSRGIYLSFLLVDLVVFLISIITFVRVTKKMEKTLSLV